MPAPKGNKNAKGNEGGRPRIYDYEKEAKELDEWSDKEDSLSLYEFTDKKPYLAQELSQFASRSVVFSLALKKAKERISIRREKLVHKGKFNYGIQQRSAGLYDTMLHDHEEAVKDREAERRRKIAETTANTLQGQLEAALTKNNSATKDFVNDTTEST